MAIISILSTAWNYYSNLSDTKRAYKVISCGASYVKWYWKNPAIQVKFGKEYTIKKDSQLTQKLKSLIAETFEVSDGIRISESGIDFESAKSKVHYRLRFSESRSSRHILIETAYVTFFPLRRMKLLETVAQEHAIFCEKFSGRFAASDYTSYLLVEINEDCQNTKKVEHEWEAVTVTFSKSKMQFSNFHSRELSGLLGFFLLKWLIEYK